MRACVRACVIHREAVGSALRELPGSLAVGFRKFRSHLIETVLPESVDPPCGKRLELVEFQGKSVEIDWGLLLSKASLWKLFGACRDTEQARGNCLEPLGIQSVPWELRGACRDPRRSCGNCVKLVEIQGESVAVWSLSWSRVGLWVLLGACRHPASACWNYPTNAPQAALRSDSAYSEAIGLKLCSEESADPPCGKCLGLVEFQGKSVGIAWGLS